MKVSSIVASDVVGSLRFDSKFHLSRQNPLLQRLTSGQWPTCSVGETFGIERIWTGNIFARVYATDELHGRPLLVPYDMFRYMPWSNKILSRSQVKQFNKLEMKRGCLFIVCSGRNLGPVSIADAFCERFTMSHDMVRIEAELGNDLFYVAAFLNTKHGQALIRTDMNGSVIDHTDANQIAAMRYPIVNDELKKKCAAGFQKGFECREEARLLLMRTQTEFLKHFGLFNAEESLSSVERTRRFSVSRSGLYDRLDAEPRAPRYEVWRKRIRGSGGCLLSEVADVFKPTGRYKTNYVDDARFGVPMMNGRQISQYRPIALRLMSLSAFSDPDMFRLRTGTTLLTSDGRAEENLADCAMVTEDRESWAASGHVHRVVPHAGIHPGMVYLACSCAPVQSQLKALATGSVVDALSAEDVASVTIPYDRSSAAIKLSDDAMRAWRLFSQASAEEQHAIADLEAEFQASI